MFSVNSKHAFSITTLNSPSCKDIVAHALRTCTDTKDKSDSTEEYIGPKDKALILKNAIKLDHSSTLEHLTYTFQLNGFSRALLIELSRHRVASLSVQSTRYTLDKALNSLSVKVALDKYENSDYIITLDQKREIVDALYVTPPAILADRAAHSFYVDRLFENLVDIEYLFSLGLKNDNVKYLLHESWRFEAVWTVNARSLRNFFRLRSASSALWEMQIFSNMVYEALPSDQRFYFEDIFNWEV